MRQINAFDIAAQAARYEQAAREVNQAQSLLDAGYRDWKARNAIRYHIGRQSEEWREMMAATSELYAQVVRAKRRERHCRDRLFGMVRSAQS